MTGEIADLQALRDHLELLETKFRRLRRGLHVCFAFLVVALAALIALYILSRKLVVTESVLVVDTSRTERVAIDAPEEPQGVSSLSLADGSGHVRVLVSAGENACVLLRDGETNIPASLSVESDGSPRLLFRGPRMTDRMSLRLDAAERPVLEFLDEQGKVRLKLFLDELGSPRLEFFGPDGAVVWRAPAD
ncbi:MAG: hypothetical protein HY720_18885 [Planctomycetes bacterium]|nr:hypothetical protein [Planctomycetota bacterium]